MKDKFNNAGTSRLERFYKRLSIAPEGAEVVALLKSVKATVEFDPKKVVGAHTNIVFNHTKGRNINYKAYEVYLRSKSHDDMLLQALVHESQHIRHHSNGVGNPEIERTIEQECLLRRVQEADAQVKATEVCFFMKQAGNPGPWKAASESIYSAMCTAYETEMTASQDLALARRAAFDAWFDDDRLSFYDYNTLLNCNGAIDYMVKDDLSPEAKADAERNLVAVLNQIGSLSPGEPNYLTMPGAVPVNGPPYTRKIAENLAEGRIKMDKNAAEKAAGVPGNDNEKRPEAPLQIQAAAMAL